MENEYELNNEEEKDVTRGGGGGGEEPLSFEIQHEDEQVMADEDDCDSEPDETPKLVFKTSYDAKITELLRNLYSIEFKIHSEASKDFIKLLRSESGGDFLNQYVQRSESFSELLEAWKLRQGKPGVAHVLSLISEFLNNPDGKYKAMDLGRISVSRKLDKFARTIITNKMEDVYTELNSKEGRRQSAALSVMAAVVRRGVGLASEVAKIFDFKLPVFPKLAESQKNTAGQKSKTSTRNSFIEFAMSFLEVGNPRLLRSILQLREMYFGVLRGLGNDDDDTVIYVLSTLRDRVLTPDSWMPPGLRSVLFGSVTLDQLISISGNPVGGPSAKIAHEVLIMVCTDPCNGLMPDLNSRTNPLKGNPKRLLDLMKKLNATEIDYHRDLLLAIVQGRPSFGSAYMNEFPYLLEPRASSTWFSAMSLVSDLVSSTRENSAFSSFFSHHRDPPSVDSSDTQCLIRCIIPHSFNRIVINRGLLHSDVGVRHGSMRLLLEALKSLDNLVKAIDCKSRSTNLMGHLWISLKLTVQEEARVLLPDSQVLYKLLSSLNHGEMKTCEVSLKRQRKSEELPEIHPDQKAKRLKLDLENEDIDIVISGIDPGGDNAVTTERGKTTCNFVTELEKEEDCVKNIAGIWGLHSSNIIGKELKDAETYFHSKLLDALALYLRTMPMVLDGSFDFFKVLPTNPFTLSVSQQQSLLSLLIEYIGCSPGGNTSTNRPPDNMYKHLHPLLDLLIHSPIKGIQDQAYILVRAAMLSTGLFDRNCLEIDAWLLFLPGFRGEKSSFGSQAVEVLQDWSEDVVSFLCDAVSTMGNNLYKYMDHLRCLISSLKDCADISPNFSPLYICTLKKCLRLLDSDSGTYKLHEKSMISMYVCNTLSFILQTQVDGRLLSSLIILILNDRSDSSPLRDASRVSFCEWRPLKNLEQMAQSISDRNDSSEEPYPSKISLLLLRSVPYQKTDNSFSSIMEKCSSEASHSFAETLGEIKGTIRNESDGSLVGIAKAFCASLVCASPDEILQNFPSVITISSHLLGAHLSLLICTFFHEGDFLVRVANLWPDIFFSGLELAVVAGNNKDKNHDALVQTTNNLSSSEKFVSTIDFDSVESASVACSNFLKQASFHALFPAIMGTSNSDLLGSSKLIEFLQGKLSEGFNDDSVASLRLLLFWVHQIQFTYRLEPKLCGLEQLSKICFVLIKHMLGRVLVMQSDSSNLNTVEAPPGVAHIHEIVETIFLHPAVVLSLKDPLFCNKDSTHGKLTEKLVDSFSSSDVSLHTMSNDTVHLLTTLTDHLFGVGNDQNFVFGTKEITNRRVAKAFKTFVEQVVMIFKKKIKMPINRKKLLNLLPSYYLFRGFVRIIPPFMLLELADYIFENIDTICSESVKVAAFSIGCYLAGVAFELLSSYVYQLNTKTISLFWEVEKAFDLTLIEKVYHKVLFFGTQFKLECADLCLLKAVSVVYKQKFVQPQTALVPSCMAMYRVMTSSPTILLDHCIQGTTATKAKLLFVLTEVSPLHLALFGQMFSSIRYKDLPLQENAVGEDFNHVPTDEQFMMLLPVALSYIKMHALKSGLHYFKHFQSILSLYSSILLDGFSKWKSYTSGVIFQEEYDELTLSSTQELLSLFGSSLLGKAIQMLQYTFSLNVISLEKKKRIKLIGSICSCSGAQDDFVDFDVNGIASCSLQESMNLINRVIAKIVVCRMLLFPKDNLIQPLQIEANVHPEDIASKIVSNKEHSLMLRFINILVGVLHTIVKRFPLVTDDSVRLQSKDYSQLFRHLEVFILRNIFELSVKIRHDLTQMSDITFIEQFARSSFLHRFEDPTTLQVLRGVLTTLREGKFSCGDIFDLLLSHSKFVPSILWSCSTSGSSGLLNTGTLLQPMSSILKSPSTLDSDRSKAENKNIFEISRPYRQKLEVTKLLRVLYQLKACPASNVPGEDTKMNSKELLSLLLSSYGATMSEIDLEIIDLMHDIISTEVSEHVNIAEMDYLWGSSALKLREKTLENSLLSDNTTDRETIEERNRRLFRENLDLDSKKCAATILTFPYDRTASRKPLLLKDFKQDNLMDMLEASATSSEGEQRYDPAFILPFSIHGLSRGYFEPLEFVGLGLLAISFMSMSSLDEGLRKLGYETVERFKFALESCRKSKVKLQLQALLSYLQNGITEPWLQIPSTMAIFAAESSFILLDPSHDLYFTIQKQLKQWINLQCIPLFHEMFGSISPKFKTDRLWILRLSHTGLNLEADARIFIRNCLFEILLSFYSSSLSDSQSKTLILQIVKKSIKLPVLVRYLVQQCGLFSWLSMVLSSCIDKLWDDDKSALVSHITVVLEVVKSIISVDSIIDWLKEHALEQLSEFSSHALKLFVGDSKMIMQNITLDSLVLEIFVSTLRISQERKLCQPHFTLSYDGLLRLCKSSDDKLDVKIVDATNELVLRAILMSAPPTVISHTDYEKLIRIIMWGISTASKTYSKESELYFTNSLFKQEREESPLLKVLRWVTASVILGGISRISHKMKLSIPPESSNIQTLQWLLEHTAKVNGEVEFDNIKISEIECNTNEALAARVLYLYQLIGRNDKVLPSVVSVIGILLLSDTSNNIAGPVAMDGDEINVVSSLCSKIRCPAEANPSWRWSYYQPWEDTFCEWTELQKLEEHHACEALLLVFSNVLSGRSSSSSSSSRYVSYQDLEKSGIFAWERNFLASQVP